MKRFEVFKGSTTYMSTTSIEAVPFDSLASMQKAGYKFRIDGKVASMRAVMELKNPEPNPPYQAVFDVDVQHDDGSIESVKAVASVEDADDAPVNSKPVDNSDIQSTQQTTPDKPASDKPTSKGRVKKRVFCPETGVEYSSMSEAGRALGIDPAAVSYAAANNKATKGYHFEIRIE